MNSFEFNKIAGALLGVLGFVIGLSILSEMLFSTEKPEKAGYAIAVSNAQEAGKPAAAPASVSLADVIGQADPKRGEQAFRPCLACHSSGKGEASKVGPNLWDVFGGKVAHLDGYNYSNALKTASSDGKMWTAEALFKYLEDPKSYLPGNKMSFAGLKKPQDRADLITYLRSLSDNPKPLP